MKRYACLIGFLLMSWALSAKTLVITLSDDTRVYYELEEPTNGTTFSPVMVFDHGNIVVKGDTYEFSGIKEFRVSDESAPAGIESQTMRFSTQGAVSIYTMDGKKMMVSDTIDSVQQLQTSRLPKGIYIVKVKQGTRDEVSFKFIKK